MGPELPVEGLENWRITIVSYIDVSGELHVNWHIDGDDIKTADIVGKLECVKLALAQEQINSWVNDDEENG